ncbi:unnamed protein product [Calypogeia fissa]
MKTPAMESGRLSSNSNVETAAILENLGGCCEGTVFTFTSAGSRWRLRQRLNRNKSSLLSPHGRVLFKEDPADSVFTEMRIMPRSSEPNPSTSVEHWNRNKLLNSIRSEESSRANSMANYDTGDVRDHRIVKKLTGQVGGDQRGKVFPQEAVKTTEETTTTPRKSRRYLRCDDPRERRKYGDVVEDDKIWTCNEKKPEEVRAQELPKEASYRGNKPAEERRNKRESSTEEIHVFEQRKVKCRRREQDSCSIFSESVQCGDLSKAEDATLANYGCYYRQGTLEEPRKQQAVPVPAIWPSVADEAIKNRRGFSIESAENIDIEEKCSNRFAKQKPVFELHIQRGNVTEENRSWITPRPSTPPIACSFISFKGGVSCVRSRRCHILGNASSTGPRARDVDHRATATGDGTEIRSQILRDKRLVQDSSTRALSNSPDRTQRILEISFPRRNREMEGGDTQTKIGGTGRPEALDDFKSTGRERIMLSEIGAGDSSHTVGQVAPFHQRLTGKELSSSWPSRATEGSLNKGGDALSSWERSHNGISKAKHTFVNEGESGTRRIDVSRPHPPRVKEGSRGRLSSSLLDCHGSLEVEDDLETIDLDGNYQRSGERDSDDEFSPKREANWLSPAQGRLESRDNVCEGSNDGLNNLLLAKVTYFEPAGVPNKCVDGGNVDLEENLLCEIATDSLRKSATLELEHQSFREADKDIPNRKQSSERYCTSSSENVRTDVVDSDPLPQKSVPLRRQAWVKGFKKKTGEKVSYFESWLGRSKKLHKTSPGLKCGTKGVVELSLANRIVEKHDRSRRFGESVEQHAISQAWSKKESQAYVTKEFEILEAVLRSEANVDDGSEGADRLQRGSVTSGADELEGRRQERGTTTVQSNSQDLETASNSTVATNLKPEYLLGQLKCTAGDCSLFEGGEHPEAENSQQLDCAKMSRTCKTFAKLNSVGENESSHLETFSNSSGGEGKEFRQKEGREDPLALPHKNSTAEGLNVTSQKHSLKSEDVIGCRLIGETGIMTRLEKSRDKDLGMLPQSKDTPCCTRNAQNRGLAEKIDFFSGLADHTSLSRTETKKSYLSGATNGSGNRLGVVDSLVQTENLENNPFKRASSALCQQVPFVQESSVPDFCENGKQVKSSSINVLESARDVVNEDNNFALKSVAVADIGQSTGGCRVETLESKSSRLMVGFEDKAKFKDDLFFSPQATGKSGRLTESETTLNKVDLERNSANLPLEIDLDRLPSSINAPTEKEISGAERKKESPVNLRHKMPIIVRVRNRLANGWLVQHPLWRKVARHKMKTIEALAPATKVINQNKVQSNPSSLISGQGSTDDFLTDLNESWTENAINMKPPRTHDTELPGTSTPENSIMEAHHQTCANTENEQSHQCRMGDVDTCRYDLSIDDVEHKPSASEKSEILDQNQVNKQEAPLQSHDEVENDQEKKDDCPDQGSLVLTFAEWQSRTKEFGKSSPSRKRVGEKLVGAVKESEREVTELRTFSELKDVGELLSVVCLGNSVKEATVLGTFSDFDTRCEVPSVVGQSTAEWDCGGFKQVNLDVGSGLIPAVCRGEPEKVSAVSQTSSDADECIFNSRSDTTTSSYCQTEPIAEAKDPEKMGTYIPVNSRAGFSVEHWFPSVEEGAELSPECESLQIYVSLSDENDDLHTCSSAAVDQAFECMPGTIQMPSHSKDSSGEQPQLDGHSGAMHFTPQVEDVLDNLSIERTVGQSASVAPSPCQPCPGMANKEHHKALYNFVTPFGQAKVVAPFCPPLQAANSCGKEMPRDGPAKDRATEDPSMSNCHVRETQEDLAIPCSSPSDKSSGDLKQWELIEMLKLPNNDPQLFSGQRPKDISRKDDKEHIYRTGRQTNAWERSCWREGDGSHGTLCWKGVPARQSPNDISAEDQIFLERFSTVSNNLKSCELSSNGFCAYSNLGCQSLGLPCNASADLSSKIRLSSAPGRLNCGRTGTLYFDRSVEPASLPSDVQSINSMPQCVSTRSSLGEAGRPRSIQENEYERYNEFEPKLLPDDAVFFDCPSPSSSINRSLDNSESHCTWARRCTDCLNKYEHQETCVQCANGMHDWKRSASSGCFPSLMLHGSSFPAQFQSLLLNPRPTSRLSNTSQPSTICRCDICNLSCRFSPPALLGCHHPPCINAVKSHRHCHFLGGSHPRSVASDQLGKLQHTSAPSSSGQGVQFPTKDTLPPYIPLQVMQRNGTYRPLGNSQQTLLSHERHQFAYKNRVTQDDQVGGPPKSCQTKETEKERELVWLSPEEINLVQQLRLSGDKAMAICRHDAAACIQRYWRKYLEKKTEVLNVENEKQAAASSLLTKYQMWHDQLQYCKLRQVAISLELCGSSPKELTKGNLVTRLYRTMQKAASIIQRAWRSVLRNRKEKMLAKRGLPKDLKDFYDIIKIRQVARGQLAPSFGLFAKSVERIQAATEGARVRRRLKSHRLQTIIMEIKEIRKLLCEMSQEESCNSTPFLFPQLCTQLRQKIVQLHAALNGKQMEARFLLRRCPATPLTLYPSTATSPKPIYLVPNQKSVGQALVTLARGAVGPKHLYIPPLTNPASVVSDMRIANSDLSTIQSAVPAEQKLVHTQSFVPLIQGAKGSSIQLQNSSPDRPAGANTPDSAKLLQWYFLAQTTPSKRNAGQGTPTDFSSGHDVHLKKGFTEILDPSQNKCDISFSSHSASSKSKDPDYSLNKSFDEQPLPAPQRRKIPDMSFEEMVVGGGNASMYLTEYAPSTDSIDKPKRPFLKRKSRVMPPQKLDWSKVKPMVSSRLEPELKTKLSLCKGPSKEITKNNSKKKKANYSNVKSRLFSYEENVSPSNSADGTCLRLQSTEPSEAGYPPMLRGECRESRGSSIQGAENGRNSRVLANRQRTVSPDLMHLRRMAEADRHCSQNSMLDTQSLATYSSHFNSARYFHKLGNAEETPSKATVVGSCQQRTQRIRLRIVPRSKESEVGDLFVQEEMQEMWEDQNLSAEGKGKSQQSHSHRYAIYQDAKYSSRVAETTGPDCAEDDNNDTRRASRKVCPLPLISLS